MVGRVARHRRLVGGGRELRGGPPARRGRRFVRAGERGRGSRRGVRRGAVRLGEHRALRARAPNGATDNVGAARSRRATSSLDIEFRAACGCRRQELRAVRPNAREASVPQGGLATQLGDWVGSLASPCALVCCRMALRSLSTSDSRLSTVRCSRRVRRAVDLVLDSSLKPRDVSVLRVEDHDRPARQPEPTLIRAVFHRPRDPRARERRCEQLQGAVAEGRA